MSGSTTWPSSSARTTISWPIGSCGPSCTRSADRITVEESAQLAAQLPTLIRGIYYEGWRPSTTPLRYHDRETFLRKIAREALLTGSTEASYAVTAAAAVLRRHVSEGEIDDVLAMLSAEIRQLLSEDAS